MRLLNSKILLTSFLALLFVAQACFCLDYFKAGQIAYYQKNYQLSRTYFEKALKQNPNNLNCRYFLAQTLVNLQETDEAARQYQRIIKQSPKSNAGKLSEKGLTLLKSHKAQIKTINYTSASGINAQSPELQTFLLTKEAQNTYIKNAANSGGIFVRWNPNKTPLKIYIQDGRNVKGYQSYYEDKITAALNCWISNLNGILSYSLINDKSKANIVISFEENLSGNQSNNGGKLLSGLTKPYYSDNYLTLATIQMLTQKSNGESIPASQFYNTILHELGHALGIWGHSSDINDIMNSVANNSTQTIQKNLSQRDKATIKLLYKIPDSLLNSKQTGTFMAKDALKQEKLQEALEYVKQVPDKAISWRSLAEAYSELNNYTKAAEHYEKALSIDPSDTEALDGLGKVYLKTKSTYKAINTYQKLNNLYPENEVFATKLINLYISTNQKYNAEKTLELLLKNNPNAVKSKNIIELKVKLN